MTKENEERTMEDTRPATAGEVGPHPLAAGRRTCSVDHGEGLAGVLRSRLVGICIAEA